MSLWKSRPRYASEQISGAIGRVQLGEFGVGYPGPDLMEVNPALAAGIYNYHEGDLFTPGAENWVFEPNGELTPLQTTWGFAFLRTPNTFNPIQPPQVWSQPHVLTNGLGGLSAGQMELQPLIEPSIESGGGG